MNDTNVRCAIIASSFPQFSIFPDFVFLNDTLIQPKVEEWNYKTLKHVADQCRNIAAISPFSQFPCPPFVKFS